LTANKVTYILLNGSTAVYVDGFSVAVVYFQPYTDVMDSFIASISYSRSRLFASKPHDMEVPGSSSKFTGFFGCVVLIVVVGAFVVNVGTIGIHGSSITISLTSAIGLPKSIFIKSGRAFHSN
jgi:hypothetical protein